MNSPLHALAAPATARIRRWVLRAFPRGQSGIDYDQPPGDPGLFGAGSVTWRIHADFPGMLAGGLCALMLQTLHPQALAGVWDHSQFRTDLLGRLRRTTNFVAGTTYAGRAEAERLIAHVDSIHARVQGITADGRPYHARDPRLLTWVHVTESYGFLEGFRRYAPMALPAGFADRYFDESRRVAQALGARDVPGSEAQVADYFASVQDQLRYDERSREVLAVLARIALPVPAAALSRNLFLGAGSALLPPWAAERLRLSRSQRLQAAVAAQALRRISPLFRLALSDGVAPRACRRVGVPESVLDAWPG
ncbi:oxygenase MpaB family protein [Lysobacter sp. GCM10012299]|uniref:oxygenase MpaB family protein n=1 Tax=Lysobacter sp. GCM10012299 TaxID=3317333 RepID=UPI00361B6321